MLAALALLSTSGRLFLAGGGTTPPEIVEAFLKACGGRYARILVLPLASETPGDGSQVFLRERGAMNTALFAKASPTPADLENLKAELKGVRGVWMPGGVQGRFIERLGKSWSDAHIKPLIKRGVNFYGTSAGSMVCAETMILGPGKTPDTADTGPGFGLTSWVVDTHFKQRNREPRLRDALKKTGMKKGVGIDEREWIVIRDDKILEKHGSPTVIDLSQAAIRRSRAPNRRKSCF